MTSYKALDMHVLVVAVVNTAVKDWTVYIGAVPGIRHEREFPTVAREGSKLSRELGELLFPEFSHLLWRD